MAIFETVGSLTERYQTTVPSSVRRALNLKKHDKIVFKVGEDNKVTLERQSPETDDPVLGRFLDLLSADIAAGTAHVQPVTQALKDRIERLVGDVSIDLDQPLPAEGD
jgi:antitoxin PrlF